jgi:hypothetical protein
MSAFRARKERSAGIKLALFTMVLALSFVGGAAVGALVGPDGSTPSGDVDHRDAETPHDDEHGG